MIFKNVTADMTWITIKCKSLQTKYYSAMSPHVLIIYMHSILSFKYHLFNAQGRSILPKHVVYADETNKIVVADGTCC